MSNSPPQTAAMPSSQATTSTSVDLDREVEHAKAALRNTWAELRRTLQNAIPGPTGGDGSVGKLGGLAKKHPMVAVGSAVAAGFIAAAVFVPSREQSALKKLAALERAVALHNVGGAMHPSTPQPGAGPVANLISGIGKIVGPLMLNAVSAAIAGQVAAAASDQPAPASNGHPAEAQAV